MATRNQSPAAERFLSGALEALPETLHDRARAVASVLDSADGHEESGDKYLAHLWRRAAHQEIATLGLTLSGEPINPLREETP